MPNLRLYGKAWHISTDFVPLPAVLGLACHLVALGTIVVLVASARISSCDRSQAGTLYLLAAVLPLAFSASSMAAEVLLICIGLRGAPLEVSKRRAVMPLLYWQSVNWLADFGATGFATWVVATQQAHLPPRSCWQDFGRIPAMTALVIFMWVVNAVKFTLVFGVYSVFPSFGQVNSWETRLRLVAVVLGGRRVLARTRELLQSLQSRVGSMREHYARILGDLDLSPSDQAVALYLVHMVQREQRWRRIRAGLSAAADLEAGATAALRSACDAKCGGGASSMRTLGRSTQKHGCCEAAGGRIHEPDDSGQPPKAGSVEHAVDSGEPVSGGLDVSGQPQKAGSGTRQKPGNGIRPAASTVAANSELSRPSAGAAPHRPQSGLLPAATASPDNSRVLPPSAGSAHRASDSGLMRAASQELDSSGLSRPSVPSGGPKSDKAPAPQGEEHAAERAYSVLTPSGKAAALAPHIDPARLAAAYTASHSLADAATLREVALFARFAAAAYCCEAPSSGRHPCSASLRALQQLAGCGGCAAQQQPRRDLANRGRILARLRQGTMAKEKPGAVHDNDLLFWTDRNQALGALPFMLALDRASGSLVIALRGTASLADLATDLVSAPMPLQEWLPHGFAQEFKLQEAYAHAGMVAAADATLEDLRRTGVLQVLLSCQPGADVEGGAPQPPPCGQEPCKQHAGDMKEGACCGPLAAAIRRAVAGRAWRLVVTGHSLGAGAAALLALQLRPLFPGLRCFAYAPPGGLVSPGLAAAMAPWTLSCAVGQDLVPRLSLHALARLVADMAASLARCRQPALLVLAAAVSARVRHRMRGRLLAAADAVPPEACTFLRQYVERAAHEPPLQLMLAPGRMLLLRRLRHAATDKRAAAVGAAWDAVWIRPEELASEGVLVSLRAMRDHSTAVLQEALCLAERRARNS